MQSENNFSELNGVHALKKEQNKWDEKNVATL